MEQRYEARLVEMLSPAEVPEDLVSGLMDRLERFVEPFAQTLSEPEQRGHIIEYLSGLMSKLEYKTGEGIAYHRDQLRQGLQKFLGHVPWARAGAAHVGRAGGGAELGEPDGVIVFDPCASSKKGTKSVGVARPWCGRLGKVENCQVGVYMGYVSRKEDALVNVRLFLPVDGATDRQCRAEAGGAQDDSVPDPAPVGSGDGGRARPSAAPDVGGRR